MGYCTREINGHEVYVCGGCGVAGGVRKRKCPFGYCPPSYLCNACNKKYGGSSKKKHREYGCEVKHLEYVAEQKRQQERLDAGESLRCSAYACQPGRVHVLFVDKNGQGTGFYMDSKTYDAIGLLDVASPDDYRKFGELVGAPPVFDCINDATTKRVA